MWLAKLFQSRKSEADEPPRAVAVRKPVSPSALKAIPAEKKQKGFDPYNSGAFKKEDAWERVIRR